MISFNWTEYLQVFIESHGGDAMIHGKNGLLFYDGWCITLGDPVVEIPPPTDREEQLALKRLYWSSKIVVLKEQFKSKMLEVKQLVTLQESRTLPLRTTKVITEPNELGVLHSKQITMEISIESELLHLQQLGYSVATALEQLDSVEYTEELPTSIDLSYIKDTIAKLEKKYE